MARARFNWSQLDRQSLQGLFGELRHQLVDRRLTIRQAGLLLKRHVKRHLPVSVTCSRYAPVNSNEIWVGGVYHSDYDKKKRKRFIEVQFAFAEGDRYIQLNHYHFKRICVHFADLILHELIHCRQHRARRFKTIPGYQSSAPFARDRREQEYLADPDEMGAYSFNIACELIDRFGWNMKKISYHLDNTARRYHNCSSWRSYLKAFNWDHEHKKIKQMKRKILGQLELARIGRPFRKMTYLTE